MIWKAGLPLRLETERFVVRSMRPKDITDTYRSWWADTDIMQGLNRPPKIWEEEDLIKYLQSFDNKTSFHLGLYLKEKPGFIGFHCLWHNPEQETAKTMIVIGDKGYWGKGVVQEVRETTLSFLFQTLRVHKVIGEVMGRNTPSIFNYQAQGFACEGVGREELVDAAKGGRADLFRFGLLRADWGRRQGAGTGHEP